MVENKIDKNIPKAIDNRRLSIIVFSLFSSWLLSFPFEGRILYALMDHYKITSNSFVFVTMAVHFIGLLLSGYFVRTMEMAKKLMVFSVAFCFAASCVFFFPPSFLWTIALLSASFLVGGCVAAWGYYFKYYTPKNECIRTIADVLIYSNILMILINMAAIHISPYTGLGLSMLILGLAFLFSLKLPKEQESEGFMPLEQREINVGKVRPLIFLCVFIVVITINSGLMYQVQGPAFAHLEWLTSWYWAIPYIAALFIMKNLPRKSVRAYILYAAIAMIGFSFIAFLVLDRSWMSYLVVNTLMMGACGVYDLFWWSILGEMLELGKNPARIMGIGLSANVLGVLLGGLIGNAITSDNTLSQNPTLLALGVVCVTVILLPPLNKSLSNLLKNHIYSTEIYEMPQHEKTRLIGNQNLTKKLTEREWEIATLLLKGKTYRMIAAELYVSENTVKTHVKNIYSKAGVKSRGELMNILLETHRFSAENVKINK